MTTNSIDLDSLAQQKVDAYQSILLGKGKEMTELIILRSAFLECSVKMSYRKGTKTSTKFQAFLGFMIKYAHLGPV